MPTRIARVIFDLSMLASMGRPYNIEPEDVSIVTENYVYNADGSFNKHERKDITLLLSEAEIASIVSILQSAAAKVEKQ